MANYDAIIIGAGHNGLVTAAYLGKADKKVLVVEQRPIIGGIAATEEIFPGYKYSTGAHLCAQLASEIIADLELKRHGLEILRLDPLISALNPDGSPLIIQKEQSKAEEAIGHASKTDAAKYRSFCSLIRHLSSFLRTLYGLTMPDRSRAESFNPMDLVKVGWKFHRLGKEAMYEFLRVLPMSMTDLLNEWFESELLKAAIAAGGLHGSFVGPHQQGTAYVFLHHQIGEANGAFRTAGLVRGGIANLAQALARAAQQHGAAIKTGVEVLRVITKSGVATGIVLSNGDEITADVVISNADVKRTFLQLVEPTYLDPLFLLQIKNIRARGIVGRVNLALDRLPAFKGLRDGPANLGGVVHIGPSLEYLERSADDAKYGRFSSRPFLEITIPSVADPSLAPAGKHVMSIWMQSAPYHLRESTWDRQRDPLGDIVVNTIEEYAPGFKNSILHCQVTTPLDLERAFNLTEGHLYHSELALDQIFFMRPVPGWSRYHTPIENLYLCGSGTHPGGGVTGLPGYYAAKEILKSWPGVKK